MPVEQTDNASSANILEHDGIRKAICGYTWPGIEYGEPPSCSYTFFEYVDAVRFGDIARWKHIEAECSPWWFPTLDRGAGSVLHFAVDHGQLSMVEFLLNHRTVEVNQQDVKLGWTPLHRCARMAHYKHRPYLQIFELLLQHGADPSIRSSNSGVDPQGESAIDVAVVKGYEWEEGQVRERLQALIDQYKNVPKKPAYTYSGPSIGPKALRVLQQWEKSPKLYPPKKWRAPPTAGHQGAAGMRPYVPGAWKPAGDGGGSYFMRPMTDSELALQAQLC